MVESKKRKWTRGEILEVLKDVEGSLEKAADIIFQAMSPEERYDQETQSHSRFQPTPTHYTLAT